MWGGLEILLDPSCAAVSSVFPVMGAYADETTAEGVTVDAVRIRGLVVMGGVEVRNDPSRMGSGIRIGVSTNEAGEPLSEEERGIRLDRHGLEVRTGSAPEGGDDDS